MCIRDRYKNRSDAVALLLEYEAHPNSQCTNGDTALHYAMTYGDFDGVVELMLRAGASPLIRSHAGPSAYDLALNNKRRRSLALMDAEAESSSTADDESDGGRAPRRPRESSPAAGRATKRARRGAAAAPPARAALALIHI